MPPAPDAGGRTRPRAAVAASGGAAPERQWHVDGALGEGGGQVLRLAVALAAVKHRALRVENIRHRRPKPGLQAQHAACARAVADLTGAVIEGCEVGSTALNVAFAPPHVPQLHGAGVGERHEVNVNTAGATTLVLQAVLPPLLMPGNDDEPPESAVRYRVTGGTDVAWAPTADYAKYVLLPVLRALFVGVHLDLQIERRGFYPIGLGAVTLSLDGRDGNPPQPLCLPRRGTPERFAIRALHVNKKRAQELADGLYAIARRSDALAGASGEAVVEHAGDAKVAGGPRAGVGSILLTVTTSTGAVLGYSALMDRASDSGEAPPCFADLVAALERDAAAEAALDEHMTDQILPFLAFATGASTARVRLPLSAHATTSIDLLEALLGTSFTVEKGDTEIMGTLKCSGLGTTAL